MDKNDGNKGNTSKTSTNTYLGINVSPTNRWNICYVFRLQVGYSTMQPNLFLTMRSELDVIQGYDGSSVALWCGRVRWHYLT